MKVVPQPPKNSNDKNTDPLFRYYVFSSATYGAPEDARRLSRLAPFLYEAIEKKKRREKDRFTSGSICRRWTCLGGTGSALYKLQSPAAVGGWWCAQMTECVSNCSIGSRVHLNASRPPASPPRFPSCHEENAPRANLRPICCRRRRSSINCKRSPRLLRL